MSTHSLSQVYSAPVIFGADRGRWIPPVPCYDGELLALVLHQAVEATAPAAGVVSVKPHAEKDEAQYQGSLRSRAHHGGRGWRRKWYWPFRQVGTNYYTCTHHYILCVCVYVSSDFAYLYPLLHNVNQRIKWMLRRLLTWCVNFAKACRINIWLDQVVVMCNVFSGCMFTARTMIAN